MGIIICKRDIAFRFSRKSRAIFSFLPSQVITYCISAARKRIVFKNFQDRVTRFYAPVAGNERLAKYVCMRHIIRARMYCGRQSRARTKDPIRRYEHADPGLWTYANQWQVVYEQALEKRTSGGTSRYQACPTFLFAILLETLVLLSRRNGPTVSRRKWIFDRSGERARGPPLDLIRTKDQPARTDLR